MENDYEPREGDVVCYPISKELQERVFTQDPRVSAYGIVTRRVSSEDFKVYDEARGIKDVPGKLLKEITDVGEIKSLEPGHPFYTNRESFKGLAELVIEMKSHLDSATREMMGLSD